MSYTTLPESEQLRPGLWIKKCTRVIPNLNGIIISSHRALRVVHLSPNTCQITTCSVQEFYQDARMVYFDTRFQGTLRKIYGGFFTGSLNYIEKCEAHEEVEKNARYYVEHPEKWQVRRDGVYMVENEAFAVYCTSKVKNEVNRDEIKLGDHLYILTKKEQLTTEHCIVVGRARHDKQLRVACFSVESSTIIITSVEEFADGRRIGRADYPSKPVEEAVELAMTFVRNPQKWINDYHHNPNLRFAEYCKKRVTQPIPFYIEFLKPGDHVFAKDEDEVYRNHGIFLGGGDAQRKIALFSPENAFTSLEQFLQDCRPVLYWCNNPLPLLSTTNVSTMPKDDSKGRVGRLFHFISKSMLRPGDHIYAYRKLGLYQHHGIYIGTNHKGEHMVVHFTGDGGGLRSKSSAGIIKSTLNEFKGWKHILRLACYGASIEDMKKKISGTTQTLESLPPQVVVATAEYYAEHPGEWGEYNLVDNNCEMFALYCKTGIRITGLSQIQGYSLGFVKYKYFPDV